MYYVLSHLMHYSSPFIHSLILFNNTQLSLQLISKIGFDDRYNVCQQMYKYTLYRLINRYNVCQQMYKYTLHRVINRYNVCQQMYKYTLYRVINKIQVK